MTKDIKFLKTCMEKEEISLEETRNPRLQKIIQKRIALYKEQIEILEEIEKKEAEDIDALDYLFKNIEKYIIQPKPFYIKTFTMSLTTARERRSVQKKFLKNLLTNELPKNCKIDIRFSYDCHRGSGILTVLTVLKDNIPYFKESFIEVSKEEFQKIAMLYIKRGGKSLEKQIQDRKVEAEEVIKQHNSIIRKRKKFLNTLKEFETMLKIETEDKEVI